MFNHFLQKQTTNKIHISEINHFFFISLQIQDFPTENPSANFSFLHSQRANHFSSNCRTMQTQRNPPSGMHTPPHKKQIGKLP